MFNNDLFSRRLKELRLARELKQSDLGIGVGLSMQAVSDIENGRRTTTVEKLVAIADFLSVSLDYLVGRNEKNSFNRDSLSDDQKELLTIYNSLNDFSKGILIENARIMTEKQPKKAQ